MAKVKTSVSRKRELMVLAWIHDRSEAREGSVVSLKCLAQETALTVNATRGAVQRLTDKGLIRVQARTYPRGGVAENAYIVTQAGEDALAAFFRGRADVELDGAADATRLQPISERSKPANTENEKSRVFARSSYKTTEEAETCVCQRKTAK